MRLNEFKAWLKEKMPENFRENEPMQASKYLEKMRVLSPQPWIASIRVDNYLAQKKYCNKDIVKKIYAKI